MWLICNLSEQLNTMFVHSWSRLSRDKNVFTGSSFLDLVKSIVTQNVKSFMDLVPETDHNLHCLSPGDIYDLHYCS